MDSFCSVHLVELPGSCGLNVGVLVRDRRCNGIRPPTTMISPLQVDIHIFSRRVMHNATLRPRRSPCLCIVAQTRRFCHHQSDSLFTTTFKVTCPILAVRLIARFTRSAFQILKGDKVSRQVHHMLWRMPQEGNINVQESWLPHLNFVADNLRRHAYTILPPGNPN